MIIRAGRQWPKRRRYGVAARHGATSGCPHDARTLDPSGQATLHRAAATASIEIAEPSPRGVLTSSGRWPDLRAGLQIHPLHQATGLPKFIRAHGLRLAVPPRDTTTLHPPAVAPITGHRSNVPSDMWPRSFARSPSCGASAHLQQPGSTNHSTN